MDEERYSQIERENYLLLDKMSYIMTHPQLLDEKYMGAPVTYGKSLNKEFRKRELMRITEENQVGPCRSEPFQAWRIFFDESAFTANFA